MPQASVAFPSPESIAKQKPELQELFSALKSVQGSVLNAPKLQSVIKGIDGSSFADNQKLISMGLLHRAAQACETYDDFEEIFRSGSLPPMRLTSAEMELVRGGVAPIVAFGFVMACRYGPTICSELLAMARYGF